MKFARFCTFYAKAAAVALVAGMSSVQIAAAQSNQEVEEVQATPVTDEGQTNAAASITETHLAAAKAAMKATGASSRLDRILPEVASFTKAGLINNRPDIEPQITEIVDAAAIELAARRGPLEDEVAAIYANSFTEEELKQIDAFFSSDAGTKFLAFTPRLFQQIDKISGVWRTGITRDLGRMVQTKLTEQGLQ